MSCQIEIALNGPMLPLKFLGDLTVLTIPVVESFPNAQAQSMRRPG